MHSEAWKGAPTNNLENVFTTEQIEDMVDMLRTESQISRRKPPSSRNKV